MQAISIISAATFSAMSVANKSKIFNVHSSFVSTLTYPLKSIKKSRTTETL